MHCFSKYGIPPIAIFVKFLHLTILTMKSWLLQEHKYFEDAFKVYEKGTQIFKYPHVKDIWITYLSKFVKRYGKNKLERARLLFEDAVKAVWNLHSLWWSCVWKLFTFHLHRISMLVLVFIFSLFWCNHSRSCTFLLSWDGWEYLRYHRPGWFWPFGDISMHSTVRSGRVV